MRRRHRGARIPRSKWWLIGLAVFVVLCAVWLLRGWTTEPVDSFKACASAGYPVTESNPPVCRAPARNFTGPLESASPAPVTNNLPFDLLVDANSPSDYPRGWQVITSAADWQTFWSAMHRGLTPQPPIIPVDFKTDDVVALAEGAEPTPGYHVVVTSIQTSAAGTTVAITETTPDNCHEPARITRPYYLVRTAKLAEPVSFVLSQSKHTCMQ